ALTCQRFSCGENGSKKKKRRHVDRTPKYYRSTFSSVRNNTFAPFSISFGRENSFGEWLMPPTLGMKIMPTGARRAMSWASWPAPLGICLVVKPRSLADGLIRARRRESVGAVLLKVMSLALNVSL